ncbi:NAD(P)-dependent dehydrogenase (short-subunit alcohol dehydrogenase family) [Rhodococcus rhodochrous J45]|uniref:NAD(P)-dependent dehydrogenase (Short-subunit alcohol dehydrogenase family) n=1 Tax=Rhodococcus rhodochrous J45 TaxID=935266 RepID=A0A562DL16_RHORH|nr:SDR family oxidoreductase [Rhodococcus rhodochrous]TWH10305.1 NAD(P)-dependent dehydrogenase (short-subunit alcohol dehydrogenase family) [Rhodococcus rhodochrous J45]
MAQLEGRVALVTEGGSGIGLGTGKRMVEEGATVYITGRGQAGLDDATARLCDRVCAIRADVSKKTEMEAVADAIRHGQGKLDIVFANAGAPWDNTVENITEEEFDNGITLDGKGTLFTVQAALPLMGAGSTIIVNTSITKKMGVPTFGVYAATKAALRSFVRTWTNELRDRRSRVNAISPGVIHTEAYEKDTGVEGSAAYVRRVTEEIPAGRCPKDIGNAMAFLASERAPFINGVELAVDGSQTQIYAGHN